MDIRSNPEQEERFASIASAMEAAGSIAICAHTNPDGDALGSGLALAAALRAKWPEKEVVSLLADPEPIPRLYDFLPFADTLVHAADYDGAPDLFVSVDLSDVARLHDGEAVMRRARRSAIMDHHPCEEPYTDLALIRPDAAAAGVIVAEFALHLGVRITPQMAQCLFCALSTDTGRFQYQNADAEAFSVASLLVDAGASPSEVSLNVYQNYSLPFLHLKSAVMGRITTFAEGKVAYSYATAADLERTGASPDECDGLIDVVRSVAGSEVALFLKELPDGRVRGNLRSKSDLDISGIARELGGGGHRAAAGFTIKSDLDEVLSAALPRLVALFSPVASEGGRGVQ
ncbi:bifunctional oligoribonuclease/PAP phosphatase NrnA [Olsenella sp. DNF00959]|uniref:DHH family phosphoesterase n=1 Tax=Olsenella sp. DNF00959 TaxID=1476999 RepID=UPI0007959657|nr:DHH family phosphoesterase [Olsenella sp. DNF00959]KXB63432.1 DHHA1 domain protein [Olsenella sp. DNF00959]